LYLLFTILYRNGGVKSDKKLDVDAGPELMYGPEKIRTVVCILSENLRISPFFRIMPLSSIHESPELQSRECLMIQ